MIFEHDKNRIWMEDDAGKMVAEITFPLVADNTVDINHTFVDDCLRGQGVAGQLVQEAVKQIRYAGWHAAVSCTYAQAWFKKHAEASDILSTQ